MIFVIKLNLGSVSFTENISISRSNSTTGLLKPAFKKFNSNFISRDSELAELCTLKSKGTVTSKLGDIPEKFIFPFLSKLA